MKEYKWEERPRKMFGNTIMDLPVELILPIGHLIKNYLNEKYPCTNDDNCGDDMPLEDIVISMAHDYLVYVYNKNTQIIDEVHQKFIEEIKHREGITT